MLNDPETIENIIATTPGLDKDPSVLGNWLPHQWKINYPIKH